MIELQRAAEIAYNFDEISKREFGGAITVPEFKPVSATNELITAKHPKIPGAKLVPLKANFDRLTKGAGQTFGLLTYQGRSLVIYPGVITTRTTDKQIHFTYLNDPIDPSRFQYGSTPLQELVLNGGLDIQDKSVGSSHSHSTVIKTATELGHTAMAVRALTDPATMRSLTNREHIAHAWSDAPSGIAPIITKRDHTKPGIFDLSTSSGARNIDFRSTLLTRDSSSVLVQAESLTGQSDDSGIKDSKRMVIGLGLLAAQQLHGNATQDKMLDAMDKI